MRLLTHNTLRNNSADAKGKGYPLRITNVINIRVDDNNNQSHTTEQQIAFIKNILPTINWSGLVQGAKEMGIDTLPILLTDEMVNDNNFLIALYHILMNVHLVTGTLTCPVTGKEFSVINEIPNMILDEDECEKIR